MFCNVSFQLKDSSLIAFNDLDDSKYSFIYRCHHLIFCPHRNHLAPKDVHLGFSSGLDVLKSTVQMMVFQGNENEAGRFCNLIRVNDWHSDLFPVHRQAAFFEALVALTESQKRYRKVPSLRKHRGMGSLHGSGADDSNFFNFNHTIYRLDMIGSANWLSASQGNRIQVS